MLLIVIITAALAIFLISADASWGNVLSDKRNNLVFEGRIQEYGAYALRKEQPRTMMYAVLLTTGIVSSILFASRVNSEKILPTIPFVNTDFDLTIQPPPIESKRLEIEKPQPPQEKPNIAAAAASAGSNNSGDVEVIEEIVKPVELVSQPGQGGDDETIPNTPGGKAGGTGTGDGDDKGDDKGSSGSTFNYADWAPQMPSYPGGEKEMMKYIQSKVKFSELDKDRGVNGTMFISFIVHTDGSITGIEVVRSIRNGDELARKVVKAISEMPKWNPGMNGKIPVAVRYTMPVSFKLINN